MQKNSCGSCKNQLSPTRSYPTCCKCSFTFHFKCVDNTYQSSWKRLTVSERKLYECPDCKSSESDVHSRSRNSSTSSKRGRDPSLDIDVNLNKQRRLRMGSPTDENIQSKLSSQDKADIARGIFDLLSEKFDNKFESLEMRIGKKIETEIHQLREETFEEMKDLRTLNLKLTDEVKLLKSQVVSLQNQRDADHQYSMKGDLIISGVPFNDQERTEDVVRKLASHLKVDLTDYDITAVHRLQKKDSGDVPIIVRFLKYAKKEEFKAAAKTVKPTAKIFGGVDKQVIFINDHLTRKNGELFRKARMLRNDPHNFKFVWCRNGKIFVRKIENALIHVINAEEDIEKLK